MKKFSRAKIEFVFFDSEVDIITGSDTGLGTYTGDDGDIELPWDFDEFGL